MSLILKATLLALGICAGAMSSNVGNDHINDSNMFVRTIYNELSKPRIEVTQVQTELAERPYFASDGRIICKNNELYGYLDYSGNVVIPAQYSHAQGFSGGLAKVYRDGVQSIIDTEGYEVFNEKTVLKQMNEHYEYVDIQDFHEGLAVAGYDDTWGYIDVRGQFVIEPGLYFGLSEFGEGLAEVVKTDGSRVFIDRNGNIVFSCHENFAYDPFQEGLSTTYSFDNGKMGYVNRIGELVIPFEFEHAGKFNDGYAVASKNNLYGIINKNGNFVIDPLYTSITMTSQGYYAANDGVTLLYLTKNLKPIVRLNGELSMARENGLQIEGRQGEYKVFDIFDNHLGNWESYSALNDGLYYVNDSFIVDINNLYRWTAADQSLSLKEDYIFTFVNDSGDIILELEGYDEVNRFEGGYASVKKAGLYGFIDKTGQVVIPVKYDYVEAFYEGYAQVLEKDMYYYISPDGTQYSRGEHPSFRNDDYTIIVTSEGYGLLHAKSEQTILEPIYADISEPEEGLFILRSYEGKSGLYNANEDVFTEMQYSGLYALTDDLFYALSGEGVGTIIDSKGQLQQNRTYEDLLCWGNALIKGTENGKMGILDLDLKELMPFEYDFMDLSELNDIHIAITVYEEAGYYTYIYDRKTKEITDKKYIGKYWDGNDEVIILIDESGNYSVSDYSGKITYKTTDRFLEIDDKHMTFKDDYGSCYLVDMHGNTYLKDAELIDVWLPVTKNAVVAIKTDGALIIGLDGQQRTAKYYDKIIGTESGILTVESQGSREYLDMSGNNIINTSEFVKVMPFSDGMGLVVRQK